MNTELRTLPAIDKILSMAKVTNLISEYGLPLTKFAAQSSVELFRKQILEGGKAPTQTALLSEIEAAVKRMGSPSLKAVINGTGVVLHTNLGRAPLGEHLFEEVKGCLTGYSNLELDLETGQRGDRYHHATHLLKFITGAEELLIVNNNAAALIFILHAFSKGRECVVSRGELVEIGGSFRVPDIMESSGAIMKEVGSTNKTNLLDYKKAIYVNTAILCKIHRSNFIQKGFTQEVSVAELAQLGAEHHILTLYDMGSGLIRNYGLNGNGGLNGISDLNGNGGLNGISGLNGLNGEPSVKEAIESGVDLVCFSADKLMGSCQAGIIAGKRSYIEALKKHPMLRALRVCKITIAILEASARHYLDEKRLFTQNVLFYTLRREAAEHKSLADYLSNQLRAKGIESSVICSEGQYGGGAMPDRTIPSFSVVLSSPKGQQGQKEQKGQKGARFAKELHIALLGANKPILTNIIKGAVHINMLCIEENQKDSVVEIISEVYEALHHRNGGSH